MSINSILLANEQHGGIFQRFEDDRASGRQREAIGCAQQDIALRRRGREPEGAVEHLDFADAINWIEAMHLASRQLE